MGTLFSCVFRAIELVTGTDTPPDPGGDTDPGGGCLDANNNGICDDEEDDGCDEEAIYYQCSFNDQPTSLGGGSCDPQPIGSFSKQDLIDANNPDITDCSQNFPAQILVGGRPAFLDPGSDNCCVTVDYFFCENPLVECPDEGCEPTPVEFNSREEGDTPGQVNGVPGTPQGTGYKDEEDCKNLPCCTNPPPDQCYVAKCSQGSQVNTNVPASNFGGTCPTGTAPILGQDSVWYVAANGGGTLLCKCSDFICDTDDDSCKQRSENLDGNPNNECPPADGYPTLAQCQSDETNECCRRYDPDSPGVFDPNNNFNQDISNALTASYSFINSLDSSQGNVITICPDIQNYRFTIGSEPGSAALPPTLLDYEKTITGGPGVVIDPGNGNITVSIADIPENGASYTVTFTRNCGDPNGIDQGSIVFNLAPDDFYKCENENDCTANGVTCLFQDDGVTASVRDQDEESRSDPGLFDSNSPGTGGLPPGTGRSSDSTTNSSGLFRSRDTDAVANPNATSDYLRALEARKASEKLFDPVVSNKRPGPRQRVPYIPVRNTGFSKNLFGTFIDYRISLVRDYYNNQDEDDAEDYSEFIFADLTLQNIERSLKPSVRSLLNDKKTIEGVPLRNRVLQKIKDLIVKDELQYYKVEQVVDMVTNTSNEQENFKRFTTFQTNQQVVDIVENSPTLDPNGYTGLDKQRVTYWKTIAPDLQKNISVVNEDLSVDQVEVKLDDTVDILTADGVTTCSISITDFDTLEVSTHLGTLFPITLDTQIARSKVPNFEDLTRIFSLLKETYDFKVTAKSEATDKIEEDADLDSERRPFYFFQLDPSTVVDLDRRNPLIRLSQCKYILRTGEQKIKDWVETKPYPFYNLYVNHNDLFIDHMFKSRELTLEFKDISLDSFSTFADDYPIIPRRIPWYIVVIPSDRSDIMSSAGVSKLENYNTRVMYFNISPDTNRYKQKWDTSILKENQGEAFQNSQDGSIVVENYNFQYDSTKVDTEIKPYIGGSEPLPRRAPATRALFKAMRELKSSADSFIDSQGTTVAWGSVYQKMTRQEKKSLALVDSLNFQDLRSKILRGEPSDDASVNAEFTKVSEVTNQNIRNLNEFKTTVFKKISVDPGAVATPELLGE